LKAEKNPYNFLCFIYSIISPFLKRESPKSIGGGGIFKKTMKYTSAELREKYLKYFENK
jgi:hypothetical protein